MLQANKQTNARADRAAAPKKRPGRPPDPQTVAAARRARAYRKRAAIGAIVIGVEVDAGVIGLLLRTGWLDESAIADRVATGQAISALLRDAAEA